MSDIEFVPNKHIDENGVQWTYSRCFFCHMNCGIMVGVDTATDRVVEIKGNPKEGTVLCDRMGKNGQKAIQMHYHPKRINHVLKRVGKRGEDRWRQIPYDQAIGEITERLQALIDQYGPETLVSSEGTYRSDHLWARTRFFNLLGNPGNVIDPGTICWCWNYSVNMAMTGWPIEAAMPVGIGEADTFVIWGLSASEKYGPQSPMWRQYLAAMQRPGKKPKLICVDPVCTTQALLADHWLAIRPGTDQALALAWLHEIIKHKYYDSEFVKWWTNGVFLIRKDNQLLLRGSDFATDGKHEDFIIWDNRSSSVQVWCSDENRYYFDGELDPLLDGEVTVTLASGETVICITAFRAIIEMAEEYTPEWASEVTGIPVNQIVDSAKTYATNGIAFITWGLGGGDQHGPNATGLCIAKTIMRALMNYLDKPGGEYIGEPGLPPDLEGNRPYPMRDAELELSEMCLPETRKKFIGNDQFRFMSWRGFEPIYDCYKKIFGIPRPMLHQMLCSPTLVFDAILKHDPYPITAMICWSSNPLAWCANTKRVYDALKALELLVVVEYWKTPTAALADYIIPACDSLERPCYTTLEDSTDFSTIGDRGSKPLYDRRMDYDFFRDLGIRMGQEKYWPWETYEELIQHRIDRVGLKYNDMVELGMYFPAPTRFQKYLEPLANGQLRGFVTPSRKVEIFSSIAQDLGYNPLPIYKELPETPLSNPELAKKYPLRLTTGGRVSVLYHSENRVPGQGTRSLFPYPLVYMHREDAREYGIRDGDWVWIENERGRIRQKAHVDQAIVKGTVEVMPSWWYPELPAEEPWSQGIFESNANVLTDGSVEGSDIMTGTWTCRGLLCRIYPCIDPADRSDTVYTGQDFIDGNTLFNDAYDKLGAREIQK